MRNHLLHAGLCLAITAGLFSVAAADTETPAADAPASPSAARLTPVVRIVNRACQSTVNIHTEKRQKSLDVVFSATRGGNKINGMGTGIVVDERGFILTNNHVVQDVESIRVTRDTGEQYVATVFQTDAKHDLALIRIVPREPLPVIPMGTSSDIMLGESVIAIGNALGYESSVSQGIVSALHRDVTAGEDQEYKNLLQTDAAINPGNSGGPLINMDGEVIGINVAIRAGAQKIGFAIPIDDARLAAARMFNVERTNNLYHGAVVRDHKRGSLRELLVQAVKPNSPAASAGLMPGDVVVRVGSTAVVDGADFERAFLDRKATEKLAVVVSRGGRQESVDLELAGLRPENATAARQAVPSTLPTATPAPSGVRADRVWEHLGLRTNPIQKNDARISGLPYQGGMLITEVRRDSPAAQNGIKRGDILVGLHSFETVKENDVLYVLNLPDFKDLATLKFYIVRDRETLFGHFASGVK
ncbi:MAG: trypsin-like peptidase domain-containing protein [Planctomyces sp.]|nr:trypsin-like peptidase domain-containing protein [Planctomyces sp.]